MSHIDSHNEDQIKAEHVFREFCFVAGRLKSNNTPAAVFSALSTDEKIAFVNENLFPVYNDETGFDFQSLVIEVLNK